MKKEQQIEEMMLDVPQTIVAYDANPKGQHLYGEQRLQIAETLYNAGYRKTFTSDLASDTQKAFKEEYEKGYSDGFDDGREQAYKDCYDKTRKETAKEILHRINEYNLDYNWDLKVEFIKLCKDYGVEVEE